MGLFNPLKQTINEMVDNSNLAKYGIGCKEIISQKEVRTDMPYFVKIGPIKRNKSGVGARGYYMFRRSKSVLTRWGAVRVEPGRKFYWCSIREKIYKYSTEKKAYDAMLELLQERVTRKKYNQLPPGIKIH